MTIALPDLSIAIRETTRGAFPCAVVLLAGSVRATPFQTAVGRSLLELPISGDESLLDHWKRQAASLACGVDESEGIELRILADHLAPLPPGGQDGRLKVSVDRDPSELRGTGGILRDLSEEYEADDYLLVAGGAQLLARPLGRLLADLLATEADAVVASHDDGTPSSLMLIRSRCLRMLPKVGFVDMKEQALPMIARHHRVKVCEYSGRTGLPVRTEQQYVSALRWYHAGSRRAAAASNPFEEDWDRRYSIVEQGAIVEPGAQVHDSVVLRGAHLGRNSTVVRSVICTGGSVRRNSVVIDALVGQPKQAR